MVLLHAKQASKPSPKLIIVISHTHGNNERPGIAMLHLVAEPGPSNGPTGCVRPCENGQIWVLSQRYEWYCCMPSKPQNPLQSSSLLSHIPMAIMKGLG